MQELVLVNWHQVIDSIKQLCKTCQKGEAVRRPEESGEKSMATEKAMELASSSPVFIFSKTYCDSCKEVEEFLVKIGASFKIIELDSESDGAELQSALAKWTGQRSVPNIFIGGNHIGGKADLLKKNAEGKLIPLLTEAGALASSNPAAV